MSEKKSLSKKDILISSLIWHATSHLTYNYQRMQGGGFASSMGYILKKLYPNNKEKISEGLQRHMGFFNTEPRWGALIPGITVALEEAMAEDPDSITPETITDIKTSLMGPLAGIGDTVTAALFRPLVLSLALGWALQGNIAGAFFFPIVMFAFDIGVTTIMFSKGYKLGLESIDRFLEGNFVKKLTTFLGIVGLFSLGAMVCKFVTIDFTFVTTLSTGAEFSLATIASKIMPKLLPLAITLLAWRLQAKGKSTTNVLFTLLIIGFVGGAFGIIG